MKYLLFLLSINVCFSDQVKYIKHGDPAPFTGYIFDLEAEQKNQLSLLRKNNLELQVSLFKENEQDLMKNSAMWKSVATENTERLVKIQGYTFWQNALFFGLGVVVTGGLAIGLSKGLNR